MVVSIPESYAESSVNILPTFLIHLSFPGFATNQFAFAEDSHVGNRVWLVNEYQSKECEIFTEGCTEEMITCITP